MRWQANAQSAALTAFNDAAGRSPAPADKGLTDLTGRTLQPGVYQGNLSLTKTVTLDNSTNPDAVFIFQASSTLITSSGSVVKFTAPHASCNVFWQVGSSATLGTHSTFVGTVLARASVTAQTGATVTGRLLASTGAVTLDTNLIKTPLCAQPSGSSSSSTPATSTAGGPTGTSTAPGSGPTGTPGTSTRTSPSRTVTPPPNENTSPSNIPVQPPTRTSTRRTVTRPPNENTTPSNIPVQPPTRTSTSTRRTVTRPPNENTTPSTLSLLTTPTSPTTTSTAGIFTTGPGAAITITEQTTTLTQPSFPTGVPAGSGPAAPISPVKALGALLLLAGGLLLLWRVPASRRRIKVLLTALAASTNRSGEHR